MKKISIVVPCFNEEENVVPMANAIREEFKKNLALYEYEIIFIDNDSKDNTRELIRELCKNEREYLMQKTSGSLIPLITECFKVPEMPPYLWRLIFRIR